MRKKFNQLLNCVFDVTEFWFYIVEQRAVFVDESKQH